jgi:hypothetical protein
MLFIIFKYVDLQTGPALAIGQRGDYQGPLNSRAQENLHIIYTNILVELILQKKLQILQVTLSNGLMSHRRFFTSL